MSSATMLAVLALGFVGAETDFPTTLPDDNQGPGGACMFLQFRGRRESTVEEGSERCFGEVNSLTPFDFKLSSRQLQKIGMFTEAAQRLGGPDKLLADVTHCQELVQKILVSASNGTEAACGPTVSWLAELHLGVDGEMQLGIPGPSWPLWQTQKDVLGNFSEKRDSKDAIFWYMMTSGSHTQHVWAVLQYPADPQKGLPVRYRILQSCFDQYTLSAWLDPNPDEERFIRKRDVYAPKNRTLENGGPGYWIKMQRPEKEGGYDFAGTGQCIMQPKQEWPEKLREWVESSLKYSAKDAFRDLQKAAAQHGQGRLLTAQEMFAKGGYLDNLGSWLQRAHEAATSFPLGMWTQELHDDFINLFGFPVLDFYPGVPYIGQFGVMRKLYESGSPWNLARGSQAKESAESSPKLHGLLVKSAIVTQDCAENFNGLQHSLGGLNPPEYGLDPSLGPATAEWVCGSELQK